MIIDKKWGESSSTHDPYALANFQTRSTDVLITTAPKAGTTWMQQILHQLRTGGDDAFFSIDKVVPWLELKRQGKQWQTVLQEYEGIKDPRIFKTHCTYEQTPGMNTENSNTPRIILTSRDPCDCCVSMYHHIMDMTDEARKKHDITAPENFEAYFDQWLNFASWHRNISSWWPHKNDDAVLWLRYEDIQKDLETGINQILKFLDWHIIEEQRVRILELCSFKWMKENVDRFTRFADDEKSQFKPGGFIRKGQVGEGKKQLSTEQKQRIFDKSRETLTTDCLDFFHIPN